MKRIGLIDGRRIGGWSFPNTAAPGPGQVVTINDRSPETCYGKRIVYNILTAKTGLYAAAHQIEVNLQADTMLAYGARIHMQSSGDPTIIHGAGIEVYMNEAGANASGWMCLDLNFNTVGVPAGRYGFIKCRPHTDVTPNTIFLFEGLPTATYLIQHAQPNSQPQYAGAGGGAHTNHIKCQYGGQEMRIPLFTG